MKILILVLVSFVGVFILYFLFYLICALLVNTKKQYNQESKFYRQILNSFTFLLLKVLRIHCDVIGMELLPSDGNFLFISNHRSNYDPIIQWTVLRKYKLSFISKKENFSIPIFGRLIHRCCFMPIDRENPRKAMETVNRAAKLLMNTNISVGVYPEGKRSKECKLLQFHSGVLKTAKKSGKPVVVSTIEGTENIFKNIKHFKKTVITMKIIETIDADAVKNTKTAELSDYCAGLMKKELEENQA